MKSAREQARGVNPFLKQISASFSLAGLQLRPQAAKLIAEWLQGSACDSQQSENNAAEHLEEVVNICKALVQKQASAFKRLASADECIVDTDLAGEACRLRLGSSHGLGGGEDTQMHESSHSATLDDRIMFSEIAATKALGDGVFVIDALRDVERFAYSTTEGVFRHSSPAFLRKRWTEQELSQLRPNIARERYNLMLQRLLRDPRFFLSTDVANARRLEGQMDDSVCVTPVESLRAPSSGASGSGGKGNGRVISFGRLSRSGIETLCLEDLRKTVPLDISQAEVMSGFVGEGAFVLVEGEMRASGVFHVSTIGHPPILSRDATPTHVNFFGGPLEPRDVMTLKQMEISRPSEAQRLVFSLSDVYLDDSSVLSRIDRLIGLCVERQCEPSALILMGNFHSSGGGQLSLSPSFLEEFKNGFTALRQILKKRRQFLDRTRVIFIPGPGDPGPMSTLFPRGPLPQSLTAGIADDLQNVILASNPCRLRHFSREIVIVRRNFLADMAGRSLGPSTQLCPHLSRLWKEETVLERVKREEASGLSSVPLERRSVRAALASELAHTLAFQAHLDPLGAAGPIQQDDLRGGVTSATPSYWAAPLLAAWPTPEGTGKWKGGPDPKKCGKQQPPSAPPSTHPLWGAEQSLWLYPMPDALIIGDTSFPGENSAVSGGEAVSSSAGWDLEIQTGDAQPCLVCNTGSFARSGFSFYTYTPESPDGPAAMESSAVVD
uniref:DNA polymerase II subunit 2 n=1 Tax=Chromera velia CCMP2878 TaxID=1169474 RepID=A0A0G4FXL3_9ALVE|eukprot:Cvel_19140.t1-p1 / transcript=Cvel_19140.t1 / gene=Cvel_19140 / organism=Chromera_velia_CCMP2878 / gene_product=DNA polymerase epsilon subunit B, putative / transcript_product=DNA polymerase epsilon subunit B, putative / location=Cvel_scaffold1628:12990-15534(+) / protein_length=722 / sequence_SO=supercontig / SO=protein_coding / is_pseudo=false